MTVQASERSEAAARPGQAGRRWHALKRFKRNQNGATIVEFAMVAGPFLMLMMATFETALMFWTNQVLDEALTRTSRRLLTGEALTRYTNPATQTAEFKRDLCANAPALINCDRLWIDVRTYTSFSDAQTKTAASSPVSGGNLNVSGFGYNQPQAEQIVVVSAVMEYPVLLTGWSGSLANIGSDKRAIVASTTFRAEPFNTPAPAPAT